MGMSIDEIIQELEDSKDYPASDPASDEALDFAIETMRKYQKIQEIVKTWNDMNSFDSMAQISEVLDGA
jgi:hypothetical protein